jgi:CDGSH-type Zn-finger protein
VPARDEDVPRVRLVEGGPVLVPGPVELELPDGTRVRSDRPVVALCACRRTRRYPFCDTSHRRRERPSRDSSSGSASTELPRDQDDTTSSSSRSSR